MAEFCRECFEKEFGNNIDGNKKIIISKTSTLCEGCGRIKPVVLKVRKKRFWERR